MFKRIAQKHFPCLKTEEEIKASLTEMQMIRALVKNFPRDLKNFHRLAIEMEGDKIIDSFNKLLKSSSVWSSDYTKARKLINEMDGNSKDGKTAKNKHKRTPEKEQTKKGKKKAENKSFVKKHCRVCRNQQ